MTNGLGPSWFPKWLRDALGKFAEKSFPSKPWESHDLAYWTGGTFRDKLRADAIFLRDLLRDAKTPLAYGMAVAFYLSALFFGWSSFRFI